MAEGHKKQLGKNMKPRGNNVANDDLKEELVSSAPETEPVLQVVDSTESKISSEEGALPDLPPTNLESQTTEKDVVAVTDRISDFMAPPADAAPQVSSAPTGSNLAELMRRSREQNSAVTDEVPWDQKKRDGTDYFPADITQARPNPSPGMLVIPTPAEIEAIETGDRIPTAEEHEAAVARGDVTVVTSQEGKQANGDYGILVMVPEQLVSGVLGQAELDGVSPSEWLSTRVGEYLSQWFFGNG